MAASVFKPKPYRNPYESLVGSVSPRSLANPGTSKNQSYKSIITPGKVVANAFRAGVSSSPLTQGASNVSKAIGGTLSALRPRGGQSQPQTPAPNRSVAPNMGIKPPMIQGSGNTSQYASNKSNYTPPAGNTPPPAPTLPPAPNLLPQNPYLSEIETNSKNQQQFAETQRKQKEDMIRAQYGLSNESLEASIPQYQGEFQDFKSNTEAGIADLLASGDRQKSGARDYYGEAQRGAAKTRRETQGQTQRTFSNLNTLDSRGEGSFQQATENSDSEFNRYTEQNRKAQADKLSEIDASVGTAERQARAAITTEERKMQGLVQQIRMAQSQNRLGEASELVDAYNKSQEYIFAIEDNVTQMKNSFAQEQQKLQNEMAKTQSFTPGFMNGGKPTNQAEYEFFIKNRESVNAFTGGGQANAGKQEVVDAIKDLMSSRGGLKQVVGYGSYNPLNRLPESDAGATRAKLERVKALVSLENASKLKGTGAISDPERALLAAAATAISGNMSPQQVESELNRIMQQFGGSASSQNQTSGRFITAPDGQQIEITD